MASKSSRGKVHALLTGPPGVGKTTLVRKVCSHLQQHEKIKVHGFYTEEVRERSSGGRGFRIGFDVVTLDGVRAPLARVSGSRTSFASGGQSASTAGKCKAAYVGKYCVEVESFEGVALPTLHHVTSSTMKDLSQGLYNMSLIVIDEIGKMELFSGSFVKCVQDLFTQEPHPSVDRGVASRSIVVLATIPIARQRSHWLVEELRGRDDCLLFETGNVLSCVPPTADASSSEYSTKDTQYLVGLSLTLFFTVIELIGFFSGLSMFTTLPNMFSVTSHVSATIVLALFSVNQWSCDDYWYIFGFLSVPSLLLEIAVVVLTIKFKVFN